MSGTTEAQSEGHAGVPAIPAGAHIHIVGIGGSGMSAIARVLLERGDLRISGSDRSLSDVGRSLSSLGAVVYEGHDARQVGEADLVFVSSAIPADNAEVQAARGRGIPVIKRPQVLAWLTQGFETIAVAGTAGKTTTTAMVAHLLLRAGLDPSFIIGGVLPGLETNAHAGRGRHFVIEADEYDRTFLGLQPAMAIVTNVEWDHPDCYPAYSDVQAAFAAYLQRVIPSGCVIACTDDPGARELVAGLPRGRRVISYGLDEGAQVRAAGVQSGGLGQDFDLLLAGQRRGRYSLQAPGLHNVRNALAALGVAQELQIPEGIARDALAMYRGVDRRFEVKGEVGGITVIDDYAHHPTKIRATLAAARAHYPGRTIWAVYQPHTFSRTRALLEDYRRSFGDADHVLVTPIYAAREKDEGRVSSADLVRGANHRDMRCVPGLEAAIAELVRHVEAGDVVVVMGAGDSFRVGEGMLSEMREKTR